MLIGLIGPTCAGKNTIASYLVTHHNFQRIRILSPHRYPPSANPIPSPPSTPLSTLSVSPTPDSSPSFSSSSSTELSFPTFQSALHHATSHWRSNFVCTQLVECDPETLAEFRKRPWVLVVGVDAPVLHRFRRFEKRSGGMLEAFLEKDDERVYDSLFELGSLHLLLSSADVKIVNDVGSLGDVERGMRVVCRELLNAERLRPGWDIYFMRLCDLAASRSNCMKRRVGCIISKSRRVIATGYNGTPLGIRNCAEGGCKRCNENSGRATNLDTCLCLHAEENALLEAGRERLSGGEGVVLYCNTCPCIGCAKKIVQSGVKEVVYGMSYGMDDLTRSLFLEAGVALRQVTDVSRVFALSSALVSA
ncbi:Deoxycytidine monophosphate (dCMP) deaminase [Chytridiales sp. JEL 0842]|nr:Deoxycytidine monophosphate (dCMP) deaminase [Chytridiales sp. JEL 0842]